MTDIAYRTVDVDGLPVFYREAGAPGAPTLLLLHGFPSSSHMFRELIPLLADRFHLVAPDLPGFGLSGMPSRSKFGYTFEHLTDVIDRFTEVVGIDRFALYVFDYGAPVGFRIATRHPERITAIITQNGNAYEEGLSDGWNPIQAYWKDPSPANRDAISTMVQPQTTIWQYTQGVPDATRVSPDGYGLDNYYLSRDGAHDIQLDLFLRLRDQRGALSDVPRILPHQQAAAAGGVGPQRSVLPACRGRGFPAGHPGRQRPVLRHRSLRAGDACPGDRRGHRRIPRRVNRKFHLTVGHAALPARRPASDHLARPHPGSRRGDGP